MQKEGTPPQGHQVAILCGGRGIRLKPATDSIPKALVQLNGRPILDYVVDFFRAKGFTRFVFCVGYKGEKVRAHYQNPPPGIQLSFSDAGEDASMLERIWALRDQMGERLLVSYCDTFIDLDLEGLLETHVSHRAEATIVTAKIRNPFGLVTFDDSGWALSFVEKPVLNYYIGCFALERASLASIPAELLQMPDGQGLVKYFGLLIERRRLATFEHAGMQITFNTESERQKAEKDLGQFYTYSEAT